ncbi:latrophilin Cirl isoform X2 [Galleria mellonella]|uniref:Latrophilin Cirl isoform X2 n=1 Tax=Galleria mellonella TaxID=7137 RepID=A0A6J3C3L1_GALME|nr:latrophilin Cirl isoform X2 [Galleria mellonella]
MTWRPPRDSEPLEKTISTKRRSLQDLKPLLEDRGGIKTRNVTRSDLDCGRRAEETCSNNSLYGVDNKVSFATVSVCRNTVKCNTRFASGRCFSRFKTIVFVLLVICLKSRLLAEARSSEPRYETAYACEGKTLKIGCGEGSVIHLIRANYGRFSITICNDHGNTDWSVNCMSTRSLRVLHSRCSMYQNCSILASTNMFGDPCPNTLKYLEAHYQCVPASTTSTTNRPSPPWLITSQPTVWRSTAPPIPKSPVQTQQGERKKPTVITPPTFRPHITLPPEVKLGDIATKTTTRQPDSSSEREPPQIPHDNKPEVKEEPPKVESESPRNEKPKDDDIAVTEETIHWPVKDDSDSTVSAHVPPKETRPNTDVDDLFDNVYSTMSTSNIGRRAYCPQVNARGLHWNWTLVNTYNVQPCPGGASGLAKWKCVLNQYQPSEEERPLRRGAGLPSGENYHDLGLDSDRQVQLISRLGSDALLKGRDGDTPDHMIDYRGGNVPDGQLPSSQHSTSNTDAMYSDAVPEWLGATPDLSECRSVWLNSLEARVKEGDSLLSISNDLAQVTSSKTLYGGDMMITTSIMKKLAQGMARNVKTFPDANQREALVADMLLGVIKTGSNLLEDNQRASWADLSAEAQNRAASALLTQLEENAFLLAEAITEERNILQTVKNICLSVRVLEVKNVEDETFPSLTAQEQWKGSEDSITIPKAALHENRQDGLVRIVFFAFNRLEQILPPTFGKSPQYAAFASDPVASSSTSINSEREKRNVTRVLNSKVISASLGNGRHIQLTQMVRLTMKHLRTENVTNPACVFWDYTLHGWSPEGCQVEWSNSTHTGCACSHLTNFAILMDVQGIPLSGKHVLALRLITLIGCAISAVALFAAIIVFQCFKNMKVSVSESDRVLIHKNLCWCLLVAEVVFMAGIDQTQDRILCGLIAGLLHYFFLAAFAWMFLEGFHLYAMLVEVFEPERPRARWYLAGAYIAPALVVLASAAAFPTGYGTSRHCWLSTDRLFVMSFVGPVALVLAANWICLSMVIYMMCHHSTVSVKTKENSKLYKIRVWLHSSMILAFLLGLTWTFGLLYLTEQTVGIAYTFTILNSLQGLFIFIFHCLQNEIFQKEMGRVARRHRWLAWCGALAAAPASHVDTRQASVKSRRYHAPAPDSDDVGEPRDVTSYNIQPEPSRWNIRPSAPIYVPNDETRSTRVPTPQNIPHSSSHTQSIASMHSYRNNIEVPNEYQNLRSRSPSCFSNKLAASIGANDWALMTNGGSVWKNTSSKSHSNTATLPHHDTLSRQLAQQNHIHAPYSECDVPLAPGSPRHGIKDEDSPLHHQGYQTTRSYNHDFRNPHVFISQHSPGSQEMIFRKHYKDEGRRKHHHHHGSQNINHTYSEIGSQQGRIYRRGSEQEFRVIQDDPVYEEIERNETMMSDVSDDNSGPDNCRQNPALHGSSGSKFFGDHRPLISYSPGDRHHHEQELYGKYGKWDTAERYDPRHYESGRLMHPYHQPQESNMRALAAVLNGENNVVCHLEPHNPYDVYQSQSGNPRTVSQPSF